MEKTPDRLQLAEAYLAPILHQYPLEESLEAPVVGQRRLKQ